jgi:hypothetical protein
VRQKYNNLGPQSGDTTLCFSCVFVEAQQPSAEAACCALLLRRNKQTAPGRRMALAISLTLRTALFYAVGATAVFAQARDISQDFERCKVIAENQARLNCLKNLLPGDSSKPVTSTTNDWWPLVRTPHPKGGPDAVAIMRTADTAQSDPDLAGLMIRCAERPGLEVLLALVRPFPPRSKRDVVVTMGTSNSVLHAEVSSVGTALILPIEATAFTTGPWQGLKELAVTINDPEADIRGVISLEGLLPAMAKLSANCPPG